MTDSHFARVAANVPLTPHLRRVTLTGLSYWPGTGIPDEFVHVHIPPADAPPGWEDDHDIARHYTIRAHDPKAGTVDLDVVTHGHGLGSTWARTCIPGDQVAISLPQPYYGPPANSTRRLLIADATGLPAIARILEQAGTHETFDVIVELIDLDDRIDLPSAATVDVTWRVSGNGVTPSALEAMVRQRERPVDGTYVWVACESAESRRIRGFVRRTWGMHYACYRIVGYWHLNQAEQLSRWLALTDEQRARYEQIWDDNREDEANWLELEPFLRSVGL
jgi:NADPH-dependent ferric siderophore reductase